MLCWKKKIYILREKMDVNYNKCSQKLGKKEALTKYTSFFPLKYKVLSNTYYKYIL